MSQTSKNSEEGNQNLNSSWLKQEEQVPKPRGNAENKGRQTRRNYVQDNNNNEQAHSEKQKQKQDQNQIDTSIKEQSAKQAQEIHQPRNIQSKNFTKQSDKSTSSEKVWDELSYDKSDKKKPKSKKEKKQTEEKTQNKEKKGQQFPRILDQLKEEEKKQIKRRQKQENKYDALSTTICQKQISVEEKSIDLSWVVEKEQAQPTTKNTRGNRKVEPDRQQDNTPGRGNRRGNRQISGNDFQRNEGFKKKNQYEEGGRPYQNSNNYNGGYNGGYNGYGGRGGRGRENINYRQRREYGDNNNNYNRGGGNYDRDREDRDRDRGDQGSNYRNYNNNNRFEKKQPYEHVNRNFQKRGGNYNRSENDFYQNRNRDRDRQYESNNNSNNYVLQNERKAKVMYEASEKKEEKVVVVKKQQQTPKTSSSQTKTLQILPRGQKCWPEMSMYVNETKLTFSYRQITEHQCDILIIPYKDLKLEMYPGNIVNKCKADYRKKILDKGAEIEELGHIYAQKCVGIPNFKAFGFLKMGKGVNEARPCIAGILPQLKQLSMPVFSILIPYSKQMGPAKDFIRAIIEGLGHYNGFTEVNISTNNAADFKLGLKSFSEEIESYMDDNKICIDY